MSELFTLCWWRRVLLCWLCLVASAQAATLFGVVSERSAAEAAAAAAVLVRQHPGHRIVLRTPAQLALLGDKPLQALWRDADALLVTGAFGDVAQRLTPLLRQPLRRRNAPLLVLASDQALQLHSRLQGRSVFAVGEPLYDWLRKADGVDAAEFMARTATASPAQRDWLQARAYWAQHNPDNLAALYAHLLSLGGALPRAGIAAPQTRAPTIRYWQPGGVAADGKPRLTAGRPVVALLDLPAGEQPSERRLLEAQCAALAAQQLQCVALLARWGQPTAEALAALPQTVAPAKLAGVINLQDFVLGGSDGREAASAALVQLKVPVLKGIRLQERSYSQLLLSEDGLPWDSVHYRLAMPELQGQGQSLILATSAPRKTDALTGVWLSGTEPVAMHVDIAARRLANWQRLQTLANGDKRIAIVYYNHPPGRHNIGADNLDVPASLLAVLQRLQQEGYDTGELPASASALLERLQQDGVNLPEDHGALAQMAPRINSVSSADYAAWLARQPVAIQQEMAGGPLGWLHARLQQAAASHEGALGERLLQRVLGDVRHLVEGSQHPQQKQLLAWLDELQALYRQRLAATATPSPAQWQQAAVLGERIRGAGIEALAGWGAAPGRGMVWQDRLLVPGIRFGKVFVGPQPPRGWELNEELLHANQSFPPPHQYLAFYHWLRDSFKADALVHLGRHSTYEFLPHRQSGLAEDDYSLLVAGDTPGVYPYIVDGVGEGIQAKRRGLAVMVDHLTPPLQATPLYDQLLELRGLVESFEAAAGDQDSPARKRVGEEVRLLIERYHLRAELEASMKDELDARGISYQQVDDDLLMHEVGHYLTKIQERFMPHGLHVFGQSWRQESVDMMLASMGDSSPARRAALAGSPEAEMRGLLSGLAGGYVLPGKGNDPIRTAEALPTGRNFHALDGSLLPSRVGFALGQQLAQQARLKQPFQAGKTEAVVLWASDTVRDEGVMPAFGLDMLGIAPVWNSRGLLQGVTRQPRSAAAPRRDVVFTTSGLFRDLYPNLLVWLDRAWLLALDASSLSIVQANPELKPALDAALARLGDARQPDAEPLAANDVARQWRDATLAALKRGQSPAVVGVQASLRLFGDAPGSYGAGVNAAVERSGAWSEREQVAGVYLGRMGHAYGAGLHGVPAPDALRGVLRQVSSSYLGRASNLYGLIDNNDVFDYLGGLSLAVESLTGQAPANHVVRNADARHATVEPLESALLGELRGRYFNPAWLKGLMAHDYAGARSMNQAFLENLWGWQVTNPGIVKSWVWDEVKQVYLDDKHGLGLDRFLASGRNVHVKTNMQAILLVAAAKGFWQASDADLAAVAGDFAELVARHGLPGSGHTRPDHPLFDWLLPRLAPAQRAALQQTLAAARGQGYPAAAAPAAVVNESGSRNAAATEPAPEAAAAEAAPKPPHRVPAPAQTPPPPLRELARPARPAPAADSVRIHELTPAVIKAALLQPVSLWGLGGLLLALVGAGVWRGRRPLGR
ncbi:cobaltochelatase subunit CobN [Vogesella indigofera]|uniref:cobaltochelatase subunit CobN n=1 Tax=Vogesella indigofera TaxID=45465 RepID=UPI0035B2A238